MMGSIDGGHEITPGATMIIHDNPNVVSMDKVIAECKKGWKATGICSHYHVEASVEPFDVASI